MGRSKVTQEKIFAGASAGFEGLIYDSNEVGLIDNVDFHLGIACKGLRATSDFAPMSICL